jgi:hypothetical protein
MNYKRRKKATVALRFIARVAVLLSRCASALPTPMPIVLLAHTSKFCAACVVQQRRKLSVEESWHKFGTPLKVAACSVLQLGVKVSKGAGTRVLCHSSASKEITVVAATESATVRCQRELAL